MLLQPECMAVPVKNGKRSWRASVWHWPREAEQTVAAGFDHDQTLQGGHVWAREPLLTVVGRARGAT